ncbi:MBOAT-domain-containing protein [Ceraceosorus guamensis]|uniref:MBOAT-domain-containing protein n=1 Tax=Ceraceosorus guamensis TaxID=1522189 RepID=A0A316W4T4_9BASI|nr:MBOAT-domain-containing protein [Ceraceosorus guamensis]PWN44769.1 MBOAT-domain-containing protein [Ceraceosorus guamensis]
MFDAIFEELGGSVGVPPDYLKLLTLLVVGYPLAYPLPYLPTTLKHLTNIVVSFFYLFGVLNLHHGYLQLLGTSLITFALTKYNVTISGVKMPWIVFGVQMAHLTVNHLIRAYGGIPLTTIEITAAQMVMCMNLTSFAWSVYDGRRQEDKLDAQQKEHRVLSSEFPGLVEFLGYAFFFPGVLVGPSSRFVDYRRWANGTLYGSSSNSSSSPSQLPPPGRLYAGSKELVMGVAGLALWSVGTPHCNFEALLLPSGAPGALADRPFLARLAILIAAGLFTRSKYYGIWGLANGSCILSGLSYNGLAPIPSPSQASGQQALSAKNDISTRSKWDRCRNIDPLNIEFANNWKELLDAWNMNTNVWLRNCVYKRVAKQGKKPGFKSTMITFITSAFWHGVAPGYYLTFVLGGLCQSVGRTLRRHLRPIFYTDPRSPNPTLFNWTSFNTGQILYSMASVLVVQLSMSYTVIPFQLLSIQDSLKGWKLLNYYVVLVVAGIMISFRLGLGKSLDRVSGVEKQKREAKINGSAAASTSKAGNPQVPDVDAAQKEAEKKAKELGDLAGEKVDELRKSR